eukprot:TRINITY_DN11533_c0_g1_i1.p2 TRINITY_DN11533_c0_g1~~TRINITY_DN11533_c0_g1_i1.p2  ORF type:complete len:434 (+),score=107.04 TRINITY_DN11533_c0_g1_i1:54-1355(+)
MVPAAEAKVAGRHAAKLPDDVLTLCLSFLASARDIRVASSVSRRWHAAGGSDLVWAELAKRHFCVLPVLELGESWAPLPVLARVRAAVTPSAAAEEASPIREQFSKHRSAQAAWRVSLLTQREVRGHVPYALHGLLVLSWLTAWVFILSVVLVQERVVEGLTYDHSFQFLYLAFGAIVVSLIVNVVAVSHFEPIPLAQRLRKHMSTIAHTALSFVLLFIASAVTRLVHSNVMRPVAERSSWIVALSPVICVAALWQVVSLPAGAVALRDWLRQPSLLTAVHSTVTALYPSLWAGSAGLLSVYLDGGPKWCLALATFPYMLGCITLTITFALDWWRGGRAHDLICGLSLVSLCAFPVLAVSAPHRGLHLVPLLVFLSLLAASYVSQWRKLFVRGRALRAVHSRRPRSVERRWASSPDSRSPGAKPLAPWRKRSE